MMSSDAGVAARSAPLGPDDPHELGSYTLLGKLGQGGMGMVYLGRSGKGRLVAIKVIRNEAVGNPEFRARFRLEAETARRVARVCTAEVLDADPDAEWPYLVTEFIEGETLARYVQRNGPLADANLEQLAVGVAAALTAIHSAGIVHRDLKPANVILSPFGPRVIDFGIARAVDAGSNLTGDLQQLGTPAFMSPEQIESRPITSAVDIWAWGGLVAFAATGHYPFGEASAQVLLYRALHEEPQLDDVDPALRPIVWHAMRKDPSTRPSAQQLMLRLLGDPSGTGPDAAAAVNPQDVTNVLQGWKLPVPGPGAPATGTPATGSTGPHGAGFPAPAAAPVSSGYTVDQDAPTRLPASAGGPGGPGGGGADGPGRQGGTGRSRNRTPLLVGGGVVVVGAILAGVFALSAGGDGGSGTDAANPATVSGAPATSTQSAQSAAFTLPRAAQPLGKDTLVYASNRNGNYDLFTGQVTDNGPLANDKPIVTGPDQEMLPAISSDRKTIVYFKKGSPNTLQAIAADGSGKPVQLFTLGPAAKLTIADDARPSLSPDGGFLVIRSTTDQTGTLNPGLYVVKLDGSSVRRLNAKPQATDPAWSPDGERIAYWSNSTGGNRGFIVVIPTQPDAQPTPITQDQGNGDSDPVWSPDSRKIAFTRAKNGDLEIFEMNSDGTDARQLTRVRGDDQDPAYAPDG
ncbi:protein kinase, partial [Frankia sp. KB5]